MLDTNSSLKILPSNEFLTRIDFAQFDKATLQDSLANITQIFQNSTSDNSSALTLFNDTQISKMPSFNYPDCTHIHLESPLLKKIRASRIDLEKLINQKISELNSNAEFNIDNLPHPTHNERIYHLNSPMSQLQRWQKMEREKTAPDGKSEQKHEKSSAEKESETDFLKKILEENLGSESFYQKVGDTALNYDLVIKLLKKWQQRQENDRPDRKSKTQETPIPSEEDLLRAKHELWENIIAEAVARSPAAALENLSESEREKILREEWLVKDPLTGICTGLVIDFIINRELNPQAAEMLPSDQVRHWEKLLIPAMLKVMEAHYCDSPDELNQEHHYRAIYFEMMQIIGEQAHLNASVKNFHQPLHGLGRVVTQESGHCLICIERKGAPVADNHAIYINPTDRIIADNGTVVKVPEDADFGEFVDFFMEKMGYYTFVDNFSLISIEKDPRFDSVRKATTFSRAALSARLVMTSLFSYVSLPSSPLVDWDATASGPYPGFHEGK